MPSSVVLADSFPGAFGVGGFNLPFGAICATLGRVRRPAEKLISNPAEVCEHLRAQGKKIVSTNGCFDLVHLGHIQYLNEARLLGDVLIVAINTDASVKRLGKGPDRPINPQSTRALQLAALECVDYVCVFDEDTPEEVLKKIRPAIHVKGGDYDPEKMPETKVVREHGGEVRCLKFLEGYSTTKILETLKKG